MEKKSEKIGNVYIDLTHYSGKDLYSEGAVEDELLNIVKSEPHEKYNEMAARMMTWNGLYHLSDIRGNIADFIPIRKDQNVLEIGAGCGAVTGTLAKKAGRVTAVELSYKRSLINAYRNRDFDNIEIHVGNFEDIEPFLSGRYDYIFLIGVLEYSGSYISKSGPDPYLAMLKKLIPHLAQGGEIAVAIENKYGLKYISGCREDHTGGFYDGIEGYRNTDRVRTFSRNGLSELARKAGLRANFYYPYPDYKLPSVIFSDERLPHTGELRDNIKNFDTDRFIAFDEGAAFDESIKEGLFPLVSNSFLVMLSTEDRIESFDVKRVLYSKHSDERDNRYRIRTDILKDGYHRKFVVKYPRTQAAAAHLLAMYDASTKMEAGLKDSSVRVNKARLLTDEDGVFEGVQFEYLEGRVLQDILAELLIMGGKAAAFKIVKQFAGFVRAKRLPDIDLIFTNIMITADGAWNIIDYEWSSDDTDPEYVIYRAIRYFYREYPGLVPTEELYSAAELDASTDGKFDEMEKELQERIAGDHISLEKMYSIFGKGYVTLGQAMEGYKGLLRPAHVKIYADLGEGFSESGMPFIDGKITDDMKVTLDIPLPEGVRKLRIDPQENYCMVRFLKATVPDAKVNGRVCGNTVIFDTQDPQFIFDIKKGTGSFHMEYTIGITDMGMYEDIRDGLTAYETAPKGIVNKIKNLPQEKVEYVKVSALYRQE
ncbi:MAG: methyltransferase [Lachnospiraceae bacterium]|nr:methyltransferase [Lachnospiraceae bacterium]